MKKNSTSRDRRPASAKRPTSKDDLPDFGSGEEFDALSDADKLMRDRAGMKKGGRPKLGAHGVKVISLSVELDLLKRADAYAKKHGLKRAELVTQALNTLLPAGGER